MMKKWENAGFARLRAWGAIEGQGWSYFRGASYKRPPTNDLWPGSDRCGLFALAADLMSGWKVGLRLIASQYCDTTTEYVTCVTGILSHRHYLSLALIGCHWLDWALHTTWPSFPSAALIIAICAASARRAAESCTHILVH